MTVETRRLGRGAARFAGYNDAAIARSLASVELRLDREAGLMRLRDVMMFPKQDALYTAEGVRINESLATWLDPDIARVEDRKSGLEDAEAPRSMPVPADIERFERPAAYLGRRQQHYGHLVTDGLARFWAMPRLDRRTKLVMAQLRTADLDGEPMRNLFAAAGADPARFRVFKQPVVFSSLTLPLPALQRGRALFRGYDRPHRRITRHLTGGYRNPDFDRPLYLTRSGLAGATRMVDGETELEERLAREGYLIVRPETLSLRDQIYIFQQRYPVIGVIGSAMHTALFRDRWTRKPLGVLTGPGAKGRFLLTDAIKPLETTYVNALAETTPEEHRATPGYPRTFALRLDRAMDLLSEAGLLGRRL